MLLGTSVDPVTVEQMNFYKSKFGEHPPTKKLRASPSVSEKFFGATGDDTSDETVEVGKQDLKLAILGANSIKSMPPIYLSAKKPVLWT